MIVAVGWAVVVWGQVPLPIFGAEGTLRKKLRNDFKSDLPPNVTVERGTHVPAFRDPCQYYVLHAPGDGGANGLIAALRRSAGIRRDPDHVPTLASLRKRNSFTRRPAWWTPESLPTPRVLETPADRQGYYWIYSAESDRVYIFWYDT